MGFSAHLWSACRCLRWIAQQEHPVLLTDDDIRLVDYDTLYTSVSALPEDAEIVCLVEKSDWKHSDSQKGRENIAEMVRINEDWYRGSYSFGSGASINIYTPSGARNALEIAKKQGLSPENLALYYPKDTTYFRSKSPFFSVDTRLGKLSIHGIEGYMHEEFRGYGHHEFYDRWVDGLDVEVR